MVINTLTNINRRHEGSSPRILIIDLNNFARYPTIAIGYLKSILVADGYDVSVLSPLFHNIPGVTREPAENSTLNILRRVSYALAESHGSLASTVRRSTNAVRNYFGTSHFSEITDIVTLEEPEQYDLVMVSAYLMYHPVCVEIGKMCEAADIPFILGGSYFADAEVATAWIDLPGLTALIGGEVELEIGQIVNAALHKGDLSAFPGVWLPGGSGGPREPLQSLDLIPFPDFSDFPWHKYPNKIIPMITGRGCGWGACTFCSDVTSTAGRTYRSRSPSNVIEEAVWQSERLGTSLFAFTDLKLNSDLSVWEALATQLPTRVNAPRWIGAVHVGSQAPNGLDLKSLQNARQAGLVRLTTGLESGSQRVLDKFAKGTNLEETSRFLHDAAQAGISTRVTMIHSAPDETAEDVLASASFLKDHQHLIDRVSLNRFQFMIGPTFQKRYDENPERSPNIIVTDRNARMANATHQTREPVSKRSKRATQQLLQEVHTINKKNLPDAAGPYAGVM